MVTGLAKKDEEYKVALYLITIGPNYLETYNGFHFESVIKSNRKI